MDHAEAEELRRLVTARYGTIHAFAKGRPGGLPRSTVYMVLKGGYPGNVERQVKRIWAALEDVQDGIFETLRSVACEKCRKKRRKQRQCEKCYELWRLQEKAVLEQLRRG